MHHSSFILICNCRTNSPDFFYSKTTSPIVACQLRHMPNRVLLLIVTLSSFVQILSWCTESNLLSWFRTFFLNYSPTNSQWVLRGHSTSFDCAWICSHEIVILKMLLISSWGLPALVGHRLELWSIDHCQLRRALGLTLLNWNIWCLFVVAIVNILIWII